jgi:hypothetical protein
VLNAFVVFSCGAVVGLVVLLLCASKIARMGDVDGASLLANLHG